MSNKLPELPKAQEAQPLFDISHNWLDMSIDYPSPRFLLAYNGVGFFPLGGIQAITGQKKNGKTFLMCQLMAALLGGDTERMRAMLPGLTLNPEYTANEKELPTVLYCDTEMEVENTVRVARRVHYICDWPLKEGNPHFRVLWLRAEHPDEEKKLSTAKVRWGKIKQAIEEVNPTAVFIDGVRDIVEDFNDNKECSDIISDLMAIATEKDCCIVNVLHENPGSEKMRGHLGTELGNKVSDTFSCTKKKEAGMIQFNVKQEDARGKDVDDWSFEITDDAGNLGVPRILSAPKGNTPEEIKKMIADHKDDITWPATVNDLKDLFKKAGVGHNEIKQLNIVVARNRRFIIEQEKSEWVKGQKFPKYFLNDIEFGENSNENDMPF